MNDSPYYQELTDFRRTLQDWFNGTTPADREDEVFERILQSAPDDGVYVRKDGRRFLETKAYLNQLREAHSDISGLKMWMEDFHLHWEDGDLALVTFEEWGQVGGSEPGGLLSTVVLCRNPDAPFGVEWLHYHETALPEAGS
jgi:hypothetical protein